jgi:hypothetical protein
MCLVEVVQEQLHAIESTSDACRARGVPRRVSPWYIQDVGGTPHHDGC